ncbi:UDP-N-acetylmuramoyl-L-alanine--D-glutamate ligase [Candidatus Saccharibacteria bacterium]|nr:UDP-N-acetylmuramoyl-L-alanine--D-glutamate ligase [Candidatus Saccharibacteria bacterium]
MKVAIVGYGVENQAVYRFFVDQKADITICDENKSVSVPEGVNTQLGVDYLNNLDGFDLIVRTVGMHPKVILEKNPIVKDRITTAINLFFENCSTPVIGVTGTKGKGTTSTLIHRFLETSGKKSLLAGNIGVPALDILEESKSYDVVVLELSSFQLYDLKHSPHITVCLMVVPEHLNWHSDYEDYKQAKANMFRYQNSDDFAIFNALSSSSKEIVAASLAATKLSYEVPAAGTHPTKQSTAYVDGDTIYYRAMEICKTSEVKLLGRHNLENVCAAIAATWNVIDGNIKAIRSVVSSFAGLPYRMELIRELNDVKYYNDSFSTTPETAIAAIQAFEQPKIVIVGGSDKGIVFDDLAAIIADSNVKHILAIGQMGPVISDLIRQKGLTPITTNNLDSMAKIVHKAQALSEPGDVVLLSTGCASFDMFKDYKDRGDQFNLAVQALV